MSGLSMNWMGTLDTIGNVLTLLILLVGLILAFVAYFKRGRSRVALLGGIGLLLMLLLSCCSLGWQIANRPVMRELPSRAIVTYNIVRFIVLFLFRLLSMAGLALLIAAVWTGGRKD